jgi:hypothetical protein
MLLENFLQFLNPLMVKIIAIAIFIRKKSHQKANPVTLHLLTKLTFP